MTNAYLQTNMTCKNVLHPLFHVTVMMVFLMVGSLPSIHESQSLASVVTLEVPIYSPPYTRNSIHHVTRGIALQVVNQTENWYPIRLSNKQMGWGLNHSVATPSPPLTRNTKPRGTPFGSLAAPRGLFLSNVVILVVGLALLYGVFLLIFFLFGTHFEVGFFVLFGIAVVGSCFLMFPIPPGQSDSLGIKVINSLLWAIFAAFVFSLCGISLSDTLVHLFRE